MKKSLLLRQKYDALCKEIKGLCDAPIAAGRAMTPEELTVIQTKEAEAETLKGQYEAMERADQRERDLGIAHVGVHDNHQDEQFRSLGDQLIAVARSTGRGATIDPRLRGIMERAPSGASEAVPSDGGFLVQTDFNANLLTRSFAAGQLINRVVHQPISANANAYAQNVLDDSSRASGYRGGGLLTYWVSEAGSATAKKPKYRRIEMKLEKLMGLFYATDEVLQDAAALSNVAEREFQKEFAFVFDDMIFRGSGGGQPLGFMNSGCLVTISKESGQSADTIVTENIVKMYAAMHAAASAPVWLVNKNCFPQLLTLSVALGTYAQPVFLPAGGISGKPYGTIFGDPVLQIEQAASIGDLGDISYVDLGEYLWIEKGGLQSASSIHVNFLSDETAFRWTVRVNGQPTWNKALSPYKGTASSISPFVTLEAR